MANESIEITLDAKPEDMELDQDQITFQVKTKATKKKGRGFDDKSKSEQTILENEKFDSLDQDTAGKALKSVEGWIVLVTGLHEETKEEDVVDKFADFGDIKNIHVNLDRRTGYAKGYALIEFDTLKEAKTAIENCNETEMFGQTIHCDFAFVRGPENKADSASTFEHMTVIVPVAETCEFSIHNIPFGIISTESNTQKRPASAIGEYAVDLFEIAKHGLFDGPELKTKALKVFSEPTLNAFMDLGRSAWREARSCIQSLLTSQSSKLLPIKDLVLVKLSECTSHLPMRIGDYTDFYSSKEHATNVGTMFRGKENALMPNWLHIPVGYHGRASSVVVSGTPIRRPRGQLLDPATKQPYYGVCKKMDIELEVAFVVGVGNQLGEPVSFDQAENHIFGMVLMNDWSARDIQQFEYVPLGPFLGKNFGTTISPWIVTMDALEPFRVPQPIQEPVPASYLRSSSNNVGPDAYDVNLQVFLKPDQCESESLICSSNLKYMYWSFKQQLAHHTVNGCPMQAGDLCGSGTISGPTKESFGSLLELTWNGTEKLSLPGIERQVGFLENGDQVVIKGFCETQVDGKTIRVGFGECSGVIVSELEK